MIVEGACGLIQNVLFSDPAPAPLSGSGARAQRRLMGLGCARTGSIAQREFELRTARPDYLFGGSKRGRRCPTTEGDTAPEIKDRGHNVAVCATEEGLVLQEQFQ